MTFRHQMPVVVLRGGAFEAAMAGARVRRPVHGGGRFQQFIVVSLMFMCLKSSHEGAARASGLPRGGAAEWEGAGRGVGRGPGGVHADAGAADISGLKDLTGVVEFGGGDFGDGAGAGTGTGTGEGRDGAGTVNGTDLGTAMDLENDDQRWRRPSFPAPFPNDITGTYKGKWSLVQRLGADGFENGTTTEALPEMHAFLSELHELGTAVIQLRGRWDPDKRVQTVTGEAAIRDGPYISDDDQHVKLNGVYVEPTGKLVMLGESRIGDVFLQAGNGTDRDGAGAANEESSLGKSENPDATGSDGKRRVHVGVANTPHTMEKHREALRIAARDVTRTPFFGTNSGDDELNGNRPERVLGSPGLSQMNRNERTRLLDDSAPGSYFGKCGFTLALWVTPGGFKPIDPVDAVGGTEFDTEHEDGSALTSSSSKGGAFAKVSASRLAKTRAETWRLHKTKSSHGTSSKPDRSIHSLPGEGGSNKPTLQGSLTSKECGFELRLTAAWFELGSYYKKATKYALLILFATSLQIWLVTKQTAFAGTQSGLSKMSLLSLGYQAVLDSYQTLLHLTAGVVADPVFHVFAATAFVQFSLFSVFEMRLMLQIWKSRRPNGEQNWLEIRRDLSNLYSRFYGGFILGFLFMYQAQKRPWLIALVTQSYWIPQILYSAWVNAKKPLDPVYVVGISATRLVLPLYLFACPTNFVRLKPSYWTSLLLLVWVGAQVLLLLLQHAYGPRCFLRWVPDGLLPTVYDYHRKIDDEILIAAGGGDAEKGEAGGVDCVICMAPVECGDVHERMVTPCNHFFHAACLERWMDVKMECPTCRGVLPPL